jgi:hypothetical protein
MAFGIEVIGKLFLSVFRIIADLGRSHGEYYRFNLLRSGVRP